MPDYRAFTTPPSLDEFAAMAADALASIPDELAGMTQGVALRIDDFPDAETLSEMEMNSPFELLGLYTGVPFGEKEMATFHQPDMIFLYRRPILDYWCDTEEDLMHVIRHVVIHEIGHHFGLSDDDMESLEQQAGEPEAG